MSCLEQMDWPKGFTKPQQKKTFARNKFKSTKNVFHQQHFLRQSASYSFFLLEDMFWIIKNKIKFA